jgi:tRNA threonylcarbamoyladenosine biosynthesis protein TsaB
LLNLLAIDTSTPRAALALGTVAGAIHTATPDPAQRHGRNLVPALHDLLRVAALRLSDLEAIAVGLGPGSYTGLRIGLTAAKTLAYALGKPLVGLDSLEVLAQNAPDDAARVAVIADAQRGELYAADFARNKRGGPIVRLAPTRIVTRSEWLDQLAAGTLVLGPGLDRVGSLLPGSVVAADPAMAWPDPVRLLAVARALWETGRRDEPWFLEPLYLRRSAAEEQWEQRSVC